jgi:hypothetical protein
MDGLLNSLALFCACMAMCVIDDIVRRKRAILRPRNEFVCSDVASRCRRDRSFQM